MYLTFTYYFIKLEYRVCLSNLIQNMCWRRDIYDERTKTNKNKKVIDMYFRFLDTTKTRDDFATQKYIVGRTTTSTRE